MLLAAHTIFLEQNSSLKLLKPHPPSGSYFLAVIFPVAMVTQLSTEQIVLREDDIVELAEKVHSKCNFDHESRRCKPRNLPHLLSNFKRWLQCG